MPPYGRKRSKPAVPVSAASPSDQPLGIVNHRDTCQVRWKLDLTGLANVQRDSAAVEAGSIEYATETVDLGSIRIDRDDA